MLLSSPVLCLSSFFLSLFISNFSSFCAPLSSQFLWSPSLLCCVGVACIMTEFSN
jgi:hypothetical protein